MKLGTVRPVGWYHTCFPALQQVICPRGCSRERLIFKKVDESKLRGLSCSQDLGLESGGTALRLCCSMHSVKKLLTIPLFLWDTGGGNSIMWNQSLPCPFTVSLDLAGQIVLFWVVLWSAELEGPMLGLVDGADLRKSKYVQTSQDGPCSKDYVFSDSGWLEGAEEEGKEDHMTG